MSVANSSNEIPVIDIAPFLGADSAGKARVVAQVKDACEGIGFFSIVGHGVPDGPIEQIRELSNDFFDLPLEEKQKVKRSARPGSAGYSRMGDGALAKSLGSATPPDY